MSEKTTQNSAEFFAPKGEGRLNDHKIARQERYMSK